MIAQLDIDIFEEFKCPKKKELIEGTKNNEKYSKVFLCHQTNCKATMGAGIAGAIAKKFPHVPKLDEIFCEMGNIFGESRNICTSMVPHASYIVNAYGQYLPGKNTDYAKLESAIRHFFMSLKEEKENCKILFPYGIGCGIGGGDWKIVSEIIAKNYSCFFANKIDKIDLFICKLPA